MIIHRTVYINPIEPEYLALRVSSGIDSEVQLHFKQQDDEPLGFDPVAQLQLVSRSTNHAEYLACPSIDVVNGVSRALIPAGFPHDPNGWALRLTGTIGSGNPAVLAYGVMTTIAGAGPQVEAQDVIDTIDLNLTYGNPTTITVTLWQDAAKQVPYDLTSVTVAASILTSIGGSVLQSFSIVSIVGNVVTLTLSAAQVDTLPTQCWWVLTVSSGAGLTTMVQGEVSVSP